MRKFLLAGYLILFLLPSTPLLSYDKINYEQYAKKSIQNFNAQRFDSCLYYNYILAHKFMQDEDTKGLVNTWYTIAIVNLIQEKYSQAYAARTIAKQYFSSQNIDFNNLESFYQSIRTLKRQKSLPNITDMISLPCRNLIYIQTILKCEYDYRYIHFKDNKLILQNLILNMKEKGDTNWYGYAKANVLIANDLFNNGEDLFSIPYYETAIRIYENYQAFNSDYADSYRSLLNALWSTGQSEKRDSYFQKINKLNFLSKSRADYYFIKADYVRFASPQEALDGFLQAYYSKSNDTETVKKLQKKIIYYYVLIDQYDKAAEWFKKIDPKNIDKFDKIIIAYSYVKLGNIDRSRTIMKDALKNSAKRYEQNTFYWLAKYYFETKQYDKAETYYKLFLNLFMKAKSKNYIRISLSYGSLGDFYWYGRANFKRSLEYYHKAVFQLVKEQAPMDLYQMPDINKSINDDELARELNNKAEAFFEVAKKQKKAEKLCALKASLANLEMSFTLAHRYKMSLSQDERRFEYADYIKHRYPYIINVCITLFRETGDLFYAQKAFEYAEKSKASLLLSTMRGVNAYKMHLLPENLKKTEDQLWNKAELLSGYLSQAYQSLEINQVKIDQYNISLNTLRHQQDSLIQIFKTKYPAYYNARYNSDVIKVNALQKLLKTNEAILEYSISNDKLFIFLITRFDFKIFTDTTGGQFFPDVEAYRKKISCYTRGDTRDSVIRSFASASNRLYNKLMKPVEAYVQGKTLLLIPDDVLNQIPFEPLVTSLPSIKSLASYNSISYLIKEHPIYYSYSGTLFGLNCKTSNYSKAKLLAVAPRYGNLTLGQVNAADASYNKADSGRLFPITGIYDEVKGIHRTFGGKLLMKSMATEERFKKMANRYDILHLATHGVINNDQPMFSKLIFTTAKDSVNEGFLNTYEIYSMQINSPLVVLSACNSGFGKLHKGEGLISLSRAFFIAGAKSTVITLWPIGDKASSKLMGNFYKNLAANQNVGDALYHAKLKYLEQCDEMGAHPNFWAGYIMVGNASLTFEPSKPKTKYYLLGIIGLLSIVIVFAYKRRNFLLRPN